jgi:hypothetical protein
MPERPRRQSFLRACERIRCHYVDLVEGGSEEKEEIMTDVEEVKNDTPLPRTIQYPKEVSVQMLKSKLEDIHTIPKGQRHERIRIATSIFETLLHSDELLRINPRFRDTVYMKIDELMEEIEHYVDRQADKIGPHLDAIQHVLQSMSRTIPEAKTLSTELTDWFNEFMCMKEDHTRIQTLFDELLALRPRYYESI